MVGRDHLELGLLDLFFLFGGEDAFDRRFPAHLDPFVGTDELGDVECDHRPNALDVLPVESVEFDLAGRHHRCRCLDRRAGLGVDVVEPALALVCPLDSLDLGDDVECLGEQLRRGPVPQPLNPHLRFDHRSLEIVLNQLVKLGVVIAPLS